MVAATLFLPTYSKTSSVSPGVEVIAIAAQPSSWSGRGVRPLTA